MLNYTVFCGAFMYYASILFSKGNNNIVFQSTSMNWEELAKNQSVKKPFAEFSLDMKTQPALLTISIRLNGKYVIYDDYMKTFINMTANTYVEDLTQKPFKRIYSNHRGWRLCDSKDYLRIGDDSYIQNVMDATG